MDTREKLLFEEKYDEIGYDEMELEACYELMEEMPISADELLNELEEWKSHEGVKIFELCHYIDCPIDYNAWSDFLDDITEILENNKESFTKFVEQEYDEIQIDEALEDENIIEYFLHNSIIFEEIKIKENVKELQDDFSVFLLENYADTYLKRDKYLCIKDFPYDVSI